VLRFASIGSGSKGNGLVVESEEGRVLLDCGFSLKETESRLDKLGCSPSRLNAIVVSHEHGDHVAGVGRLSRKYKLPVWLTVGTYNATKDNKFYQAKFFKAGESLIFKDLTVKPFAVPHDAAEPCQFVFISNKHKSLGVLTDTGHITPSIVKNLNGLNALLLEYNHDEQMLEQGRYPLSLKRRVGGQYGHLENSQSAALIENIDISRVKYLIAMHLSENNNDLGLVNSFLKKVGGSQAIEKYIANQKDGFNWKII